MKLKLTQLFALTITCMMALGQRSAIELTFTARNNTTHVQLDSIKIMNRTQGGDTVLYWPDTVLSSPLGIADILNGRIGFQLFQNYPNPVGDQTTINLTVPDHNQMTLIVTDLLGRTVYSKDLALSRGTHALLFTPGKESVYFLSANWRGERQTIKILHNGTGYQRCLIEYVGLISSVPEQKSSVWAADFIISPGDTLLYIGYADTLESGILNVPTESQIYTFQFATNIPCPGTLTVEYEGQVYNTIQIFSQCWMKENLNVGMMIQGTEEMIDNGIIEKYCFNNASDSCMKYGGLYQWNEMMRYTTQQGARGICPPGWHLPTDEEWKVLEGAVDSQYGIGDNTWDEWVFRGFDAGLNLRTTSGWYGNGSGTDLFGFSGLPGGYRGYNGYFYDVRHNNQWWTSTELSYGFTAWLHGLDWSYSGVYRDYGFNFDKRNGFSVRCLRDYYAP